MHRHTRDELYFVLEGEITIRFKNSPPETLQKGECTLGAGLHHPQLRIQGRGPGAHGQAHGHVPQAQ